MNHRKILSQTAHRPFPLPKGPWVMKQTWKELLFAHWPVNEAELLPYIPPGLNLQRWEGKPWISVSPFVIDPLRLRGIPPLPFAKRMLELNIRTYVEHEGKPGVWFLNLDASTSALGLLHDEEPALLSYTKRLDVLIWPITRARN